jgi:hypothetical protein
MFKVWHQDRGGDDPAEVHKAIEQFRRLLERYGDSRFDRATPDPNVRPVVDRLGYVHGDGNERQWLVLPQTFRDVFCEGLDSKMIAKALVKRGLLLAGEDGKASRFAWINGKSTRVYALPAKAWTWGEHG